MKDPVEPAAERILSDPRAALALRIIERLGGEGFTAYLAGGCVRDALLGRTPKDYDVATDARPAQIRQLFGHRHTLAIGAAFGVISVIGEKGSGQAPVEVATFRSDGPYSDGRRPDSIHFSTPAEDAARRDFTINGLFFDPANGRTIDLVGGREDLALKRIRAIGDPVARFHEDKLRLLRAVRFATTYAFELEDATRQAVLEHAASVVLCSGERIGAEMRRLLESSHASRGVRLLRDCNLSAAIMPVVDRAIADSEILDRLAQRLDRVPSADVAPRLALLSLSTGERAAEALSNLAEMWRVSNAEVEAAGTALDHFAPLLRADALPWSQLQPLLVHRYAAASVAVAVAIAPETTFGTAAMERVAEALALPREQLDPPALLTGRDLIRLGLAPGPRFKVTLQRVRDAQLDGTIATREEAEAAALRTSPP